MNILLKLINKFLRKKVHTTQQWARIIMDIQTDKLIQNLNHCEFEVLEISGERWANKGFKTYKNLYFPEFDICEEITIEKFDLVIAEQVFEHLLKPHHAGKNIYTMLKPGGYFLITTPFLIRKHEEPNDCTRWTETGIKYLLTESGFNENNIITGSWGNRECIIANFDSWIHYQNKNQSLENEINFPIVVWALAHKNYV